jgi:hypothetical protein
MTKAFDLASTPMNIFTAAIFGLTPGLVIDRLKHQSDEFKKNLRTTEPQVND